MLSRSILACTLLAIALRPAKPAPIATGADLPPLLYTVASSYEPLAWMHGADRFPSGATIIMRDENRERALVPDFAASAAPAVSFDGRRVLFAGRRIQDDWQMWELALENSAVRQSRPQLTTASGLFICRRIASFIRAGHKADSLLNKIGSDRKNPLLLTYGPANFSANGYSARRAHSI